MPLYEYQCDACGHRFEIIQKFSDPPVAECPKCGGAVRKMVSSPAFHFKGSGWYITDYAKKPEGKDKGGKKDDGGESKEAPAATAASSASKDSGASDSSSKPAVPSEKPAAPAAKSS